MAIKIRQLNEYGGFPSGLYSVELGFPLRELFCSKKTTGYLGTDPSQTENQKSNWSAAKGIAKSVQK